MSANFRKKGSWPVKLRAWENRGPGPEPTPELWARLEAGLAPPRKARGVWWWGLLGVAILAVVGGLVWGGSIIGGSGAHASPGPFVTGIPPVETTPMEAAPGIRSRSSVPLEQIPLQSGGSPPPNPGFKLSPKEEVGKDGSPTGRGSQGTSFRSTELPVANSTSFNVPSSPPAPPGNTMTLRQPPRASQTRAAASPLPGPPLGPIMSLRDNRVRLVEANLTPSVNPEFTQRRVDLRLSVFGGPGLHHNQINAAPGSEPPPSLTARREQPTTPGGHLGLRLDYGRVGVSLGARYNVQSADYSFSRRIAFDRDRETPEPNGMLKSEYTVDVGAEDAGRTETVEIRRRAGQPLGPNPRIRLDFTETQTFRSLSIPLQLHYRQPLGRGPISLEATAGVSFNHVQHDFRVGLEAATFLSGQTLENPRLRARSRMLTYEFWSAGGGAGLRYAVPGSRLSLGLNAVWERSLGDFRQRSNDEAYFALRSYALRLHYRL